MTATETIAKLKARGLIEGSVREREMFLALAMDVYESKTAAGTMADVSDFAQWLIELERAIKAMDVKKPETCTLTAGRDPE